MRCSARLLKLLLLNRSTAASLESRVSGECVCLNVSGRPSRSVFFSKCRCWESGAELGEGHGAFGRWTRVTVVSVRLCLERFRHGLEPDRLKALRLDLFRVSSAYLVCVETCSSWQRVFASVKNLSRPGSLCLVVEDAGQPDMAHMLASRSHSWCLLQYLL